MTVKPKAPRTLEQAAQLLGRYAELDAQRGSIEARRSRMIARANAAADAKAAPIVEELAAVQAALEPWWKANATSVAPKGRRSAQLAGCMIGTRAAAARLAHGFDSDDKAVGALQGTRYARGTLKVSYRLDRAATLKLLQVGGKTSAAMRELGFRIDQPGETFFIARVEQPGVVGS